MAQLVPSPLAPSQPFRLTLGSTSFSLDGSKKTSSFETDDPTVIASARKHSWVDVKTKDVEVVAGTYKLRTDPATDPLSAQHPDAKLALDPEAAKAALTEALAVNPVAVDASLDQDKVVTSGPVAETLAAAEKGAAEVEKTTSKEKK
jgi:hypothetical protein